MISLYWKEAGQLHFFYFHHKYVLTFICLLHLFSIFITFSLKMRRPVSSIVAADTINLCIIQARSWVLTLLRPGQGEVRGLGNCKMYLSSCQFDVGKYLNTNKLFFTMHWRGVKCSRSLLRDFESHVSTVSPSIYLLKVNHVPFF